MNGEEPNEILAELHRIKDALAEKYKNDFHAMFSDLREMERTSGRIYHALHRDGSRTLYQYGKEIAFVPAGVDYKEILANLAAAK